MNTIGTMEFSVIKEFVGLREQGATPAEKRRIIYKKAAAFRERFLDEPPVLFARKFDLMRVPYPALYAFSGVYAQKFLKPGLVHLMAATTLIRFSDTAGKTRTLLFNPHDIETGSETPFFKRLSERVPDFVRPLIAPVYSTVTDALSSIGVKPEEIDYITFDHLHTQNLRRWLGTNKEPALLPNARLLVHSQEWATVSGLLPIQADWYCPDGIAGIDPAKILVFEESIQPGQGLALVHSPGHTIGNHSLVYRAPDGIRVSSENGVAADCYAPLNSRYKFIREYAKRTGMEVILNGNTLEGSLDQYLSMVLEKEIAGPGPNPDFPNVRPSSECTPYWMFPAPVTHLYGADEFGEIR